jgi:uncharacterized membrane protein
MKSTKRTLFIALALIAATVIAGIYLYPKAPQEMASHWNAAGQVDGYMTKFWGLFLMPMISLAMLLLFVLIPKIDPLKENIGKFRRYFDSFIVLIIAFMVYIHALTLFWNFGFRFNMGQMMIPAMGILFYYCGVLIEKSKRNWLIGIRTPWTLSSDSVWDKTHKLGGKLFKASGAIAILGVFFPNYAFLIFIVPVLFSAVFTAAYSYFEYKKEQKESKNEK